MKPENRSQKMKISVKKTKIINPDKYFSAPVSTKENGLVTKFKFKDLKNNTEKLNISKSKKKKNLNKENADFKKNVDLEENLPENYLQEDEKIRKRKSQNSNADQEVRNKYNNYYRKLAVMI